MIKTKCIYDQVDIADDSLKVLVTRYYPRGIDRAKFDMWSRELAPSEELLNRWKCESGIEWSDFDRHFRMEIEDRKEAQEFMDTLKDLGTKGDVTLFCYEKEANPHCHRHILKELIEKR